MKTLACLAKPVAHEARAGEGRRSQPAADEPARGG